MDIKAYIESGVIESYVLGMANEQEAAELEQISRQYPEVRKAIDSFEASLMQTALSAGVPPPSHVKQQLLNTLAGEFAPDPAKIVPIPPASNWMKYMAAASVILLLASAAMNVYFYNQFRAAKEQYQALYVQRNSLMAENGTMQTKVLDMYQGMQVMSDPTMIKVSMTGTGMKGMENNLATVFWDSKTKDVYLLPNRLPQTGEDKQYQLWAIVDGKPVDAGMIGSCAGLCKMKNIPNASNFAITLEKKGGSPTPTMSQMQVIGKV